MERCAESGIAVVAHSPLGGPRRSGGLARRRPLVDVAAAHGVAPAEVALAWLLTLSPAVIAIPGARHPETARGAARAATLSLDAEERATVARAFGGSRAARRQPPRPPDDAEVVLVIGIPGAGKSRVAEQYVARGYRRLNRDERGGGLRELADTLDEELASGVRRVVLDNTYLSRATRNYVIETASRHAIPTRCVWLSTPLAQAQVNLVERLLERFGTLPTPEQLRRLARREPGVLTPTSQMRTFRELEPPSADEGFAGVEELSFDRARRSGPARALGLRRGRRVAAPGLGARARRGRAHRATPGLRLAARRRAGRARALRGPPQRRRLRPSGGRTVPTRCGAAGCWCRPPLPGLPLAFARPMVWTRHARS